MQNPFQPGADAQSAMNDPLNFIRKLWGDMQLPGMVTPTISVDELDKQIKDLKTVESWLNVNMNMLRGTIQALEVQRATITALKAMGESFAQSAGTRPASSATESDNQHAQWPMHQNAGAVSEAQADVENQIGDDDEEDEIANASDAKKDAPSTKAQASAPTEEMSDAPNAYSSPAAWWNVLQDQFKQALGNALKDEPVGEVEKPKSKPSKSKAPASRTTAKAKAPVATAKSARAKSDQATKGNIKASAKKPATKVTSSRVTKNGVKR